MIALIVSVSLILTCTGCSLNFFSIESQLAPPALTGKNGEVQAAFTKLMSGRTIQLKTPIKGNYQSSFVLYDINGDSVDEALVFFSDSSGDSSARMAVLEYVNETWLIATEVKGAGSGVYDVAFSDLNNDGTVEVFVGWSLYDNTTFRVASVYEPYINGTGVINLIILANEYYNSKRIADLNCDGKQDLVLVYLDDSADVQVSYFRAFSFSGGSGLVKYSELILDSSIATVNLISVDVTQNGVTRLFIDCQKTDMAMITEAVYWNNKTSKAVRMFADPSKSTLRSSKVSSQDVDGDGNIEIPVTTKLSGTKDTLYVTIEDVTYNFTLIKWLNIKGDNSEGNIYTLLNPVDQYLFRFTWGDKVTVRYDKFREALLFCEWDAANSAIKEELFSVKLVNGYDAKEYAGSDKELYVFDGGAYLYSITAYGFKFGITDSAIKSSLIKL